MLCKQKRNIINVIYINRAKNRVVQCRNKTIWMVVSALCTGILVRVKRVSCLLYTIVQSVMWMWFMAVICFLFNRSLLNVCASQWPHNSMRMVDRLRFVQFIANWTLRAIKCQFDKFSTKYQPDNKYFSLFNDYSNGNMAILLKTKYKIKFRFFRKKHR